jgi:hypothetical protein
LRLSEGDSGHGWAWLRLRTCSLEI